MRKIVTGIGVALLVLMQLQGVFGLTQVQAAAAPSETVVLDNNQAKVAVTSEVTATAIEWTIDYTQNVPSDAVARAIRFKLAQAEDGTGTVVRKDGDIAALAQGDDWYRGEYTAESATGKLVVTTPLDAKQLVVWTQVDSQTMGAPTELLADTDAAAKTVAAPELPAETEEDPIVVDTTPVDTSKPEANLPPATTEETQAEASVVETPVVEAAAEVPTVTVPLTKAGAVIQPRWGLGSSDPFHYTTDVTGIYPTHGTNAYLPSAATNANLKNYTYAATDGTVTTPANTQAVAAGNTFANGYSTYTGGSGVSQYNLYTKKSIMPTTTDNQYKIQLDVIGDAIRPLEKVDIVLVLDRSSSMVTNSDGTSTTRWQKLKTAVDAFADDILGQNNDVQMGLAAFGSVGGNAPYGEIGSFSGLSGGDDTVFNGFTASASALKGHALLSTAPSNSGTPTFLGLDAGLMLLSNADMGARDGAKKILVTITDGEPTFSQTADYSNNGQTVAESLTNNTNRTTPNGTSVLRYSAKSGMFQGNGQSGQAINHVNLTSSFIANRYGNASYANYQRFSVGFYTTGVANTIVQALGANGYYNSTTVNQLISNLNNIVAKSISQIVNATLTDPMSDYVTYGGDYTMSALTLDLATKNLTVIPSSSASYPSYATAITGTDSSSGITLTGVNLGGSKDSQFGIRIEYTVTLKEAYRDGTFYPTNKTTTLNDAAGQYLHFAIPSIKQAGATSKITVNKTWTDDANVYGTRTNVVFALQKQNANNGWDEVQRKTLTTPATSVSFDVSQYQGGKIGTYRVVEYAADGTSARVVGYNSPTYAPATVTSTANSAIAVTNVLKKTNYSFTKVGHDGTTPLAGAGFTIKKVNATYTATASSSAAGTVNFANLAVGTYTVSETTVPNGYQALADFTVTVKEDANGNLVATSTLSGDKAVNQLKPFTFAVHKTDRTTGTNVAGAKFELTKTGDASATQTATTDANGLLTFGTTLTPGNYQLEEVGAPSGYLQLQGLVTFTITTTGAVTNLAYSGTDIAADDLFFSDKTADKPQLITLNITNTPAADVPLPMTGGMGTQMIIAIGVLLVVIAAGLKFRDILKKREGDDNA